MSQSTFQSCQDICCIMQSVTCLTAVPVVVNLISAGSHTFVELDHEIISTAILLPSADSRRVVVSYKGKYLRKVLVKLPRKKCGNVN